MKVLLVNGSPNEKRCTYTALSEVAGALASEDHEPSYDFYTTGEDVEEFRSFGARVFRTDIDRVGRVAFPS